MRDNFTNNLSQKTTNKSRDAALSWTQVTRGHLLKMWPRTLASQTPSRRGHDPDLHWTNEWYETVTMIMTTRTIAKLAQWQTSPWPCLNSRRREVTENVPEHLLDHLDPSNAISTTITIWIREHKFENWRSKWRFAASVTPDPGFWIKGSRLCHEWTSKTSTMKNYFTSLESWACRATAKPKPTCPKELECPRRNAVQGLTTGHLLQTLSARSSESLA